MKRVLGTMLATAFALSAIAAPVVGAPAAKVDICHWPGHTLTSGGVDIIGDVYVSGPPDNTYDAFLQEGLAALCEELGGNVLSVNNNGAVNGHEALDLFS